MAGVQGFDKVESLIQQTINRMVDETVEEYIRRIRSRSIQIQRTFFQYLVTKAGVFGSNNSPVFPGIQQGQPNFKELSPEYLVYKKKITVNNYYVNTGKLQRYLERINPINKFGTPIVYFERRGQRGSSRVYQTRKTTESVVARNYTKTGRASKSFEPLKTGSVGKIIIDMFPLIQGSFANFEAEEAFATNQEVSYKLNNYQGRKERSFFPQYMEWWVRVRSKEILKELK